MITYKSGDMFEFLDDYEVLVHGCNCHCRMRKGVAAEVRKRWPGAWEADLKTKKGDAAKLGTFSLFKTNSHCIVNAYIQDKYWKHGEPKRVLADYDAIRNCLKEINKKFKGTKIGMPKIGAGLAGGDWEVIQKIIGEELVDVDVTVFELKK